MKAFAISDGGCEDIVACELAELGVKTKAYGNVLVSEQDIDAQLFSEVLFYSQTIVKWFVHLGSIKLDVTSSDVVTSSDDTRSVNEKEFYKSVLPQAIEWIGANPTFAVESKGAPTTKRAFEFGGMLQDATSREVNLKKPAILFIVYESAGYLHIGVDVTQHTLSKREYRIFQTNQALKSSIAAVVLRIAEYDSSQVLLDPFFGMGTIPIEAALYACKQSHLSYMYQKLPLWKYPQFALVKPHKIITKAKIIQAPIHGTDMLGKHVDFAKKNAKIAGVLDAMHLRRVDPDWLDLKLPDAQIDLVVSMPPFFSNEKGERSEKIIKECFHRLEEILAKKARICIVTNDAPRLLGMAPKYLKLVSQRSVFQGQSVLDIVLFQRI